MNQREKIKGRPENLLAVREVEERRLVVDAAHREALREDERRGFEVARFRERQAASERSRKIFDTAFPLLEEIHPWLVKAGLTKFDYGAWHNWSDVVGIWTRGDGVGGLSVSMIALRRGSSRFSSGSLSGEFGLVVEAMGTKRRFSTKEHSVDKVASAIKEAISDSRERVRAAKKRSEESAIVRTAVAKALGLAVPGLKFVDSHYDVEYPNGPKKVAMIDSAGTGWKVRVSLNFGVYVTFEVSVPEMAVREIAIKQLPEGAIRQTLNIQQVANVLCKFAEHMPKGAGVRTEEAKS